MQLELLRGVLLVWNGKWKRRFVECARLLIATYGGGGILIASQYLLALPIMLLSGSFLLVILLGLFNLPGLCAATQTMIKQHLADCLHSARPRELRRLNLSGEPVGNSSIVMLD
jgi:hypothetical protein